MSSVALKVEKAKNSSNSSARKLLNKAIKYCEEECRRFDAEGYAGAEINEGETHMSWVDTFIVDVNANYKNYLDYAKALVRQPVFDKSDAQSEVCEYSCSDDYLSFFKFHQDMFAKHGYHMMCDSLYHMWRCGGDVACATPLDPPETSK